MKLKKFTTNIVFSLSLATLLALPAWQKLIDLAEFGLGSFHQLYEIITGSIFIALLIIVTLEIGRTKLVIISLSIKVFGLLVLFIFGCSTLLYLKDVLLTSLGFPQFFSYLGFNSFGVKLAIVLIFIFLVVFFRRSIFPIFKNLVEVTAPLTLILVIYFIFKIHVNYKPDQSLNNIKHYDSKARQVVWVVMDELDMGKLDEMKGQLPNFDRMAKQGYVFTNAFPPSNATQVSLPAYWLGEVPSSVRNDLNGVLLGFETGEQPKSSWDKDKTIFRTRMNKGDSVFINGWALDYCKTFSGNFYVKCNDHSKFTAPGKNVSLWRWIISNHPLFKALLQNTSSDSKLGYTLSYISGKIKGVFWFYQYEILNESINHLSESIRNGDNFIFWHANCPHQPSFKPEEFNWNSNLLEREMLIYKNNLLICDGALGYLIDALDVTQRDYMLLVVSDHWLRQRFNKSITKAQSVPLFIKFSHSNDFSGLTIEKKFSTFHLHRFVSAYLDLGLDGITNYLKLVDDSWYSEPIIVYDENFQHRK
jgi:hypothetical protein